jgi:hypothetical protein
LLDEGKANQINEEKRGNAKIEGLRQKVYGVPDPKQFVKEPEN